MPNGPLPLLCLLGYRSGEWGDSTQQATVTLSCSGSEICMPRGTLRGSHGQLAPGAAASAAVSPYPRDIAAGIFSTTTIAVD